MESAPSTLMSFRLLIEDGSYAQSLRVERRATIGRGAGHEVRLSDDGSPAAEGTLRQRGDRVLFRRERGAEPRFNGRRVREAVLQPGESLCFGASRVTVVEVIRSATEAANGSAPRAPAPIVHRVPKAEPARRRSRAWVVSLVAHGLLLVALSFVTLRGAPPRTTPGVIAVEGRETADLVSGEDDVTTTAEVEPPTLEPLAEPEIVQLPEVADTLPEPVEEEPAERPASPVSDASPLEARGSIGVGGAPLRGGFGKSDAASANERAAASFEGDPFARALLGRVRRTVQPRNVRVVKGSYDECQHVFHDLDVLHGWVTPDQLAIRDVDPEVRVLFVNCSGTRFDPAAVRHLERFVARGGWLFSTDWGLENVVEAAFPGYATKMRHEGRVVMTEDTTVDVRVAARSFLTRGIPTEARRLRWWLEDSSLGIEVLRDDVEVLFTSARLRELTGSEVAAITFEHGRGRVVHSVGHVYQQEGNLAGTHAMQRLVLNFLRGALGRR